MSKTRLSSSLFPLLLLLLLTIAAVGESSEAEHRSFTEPAQYQSMANQLIALSRERSRGWDRLTELCTRFPHRLSGSAALEHSIDWILEQMTDDGFSRIATQEVEVPVWKRGQEHLTLLGEEPRNYQVLALGGSVSTSSDGLVAEVLVIDSYQQLEEMKDQVPGKIVLFNPPFTTYSQTVSYRIDGASRAAEFGAVGALLRSVGNFSLDTPHTGVMYYTPGLPKVPFGAISTEAAEHFARLQQFGETPRVKLVLETEELPDAVSRNVIAEITGWEYPEEVVVFGGHIDGWDVGEGAHDDAGGVVACWEALRLISELGWTPRRTLRVVAWTNEENGLRGAKAYRKLVDQEIPNHVLALESDYGTFHPTGFAFSGHEEARKLIEDAAKLAEAEIGPMKVTTPGGGADIAPLMDAGVPGGAIVHEDDRYFWYHHTHADTMDKIDRRDFVNNVALLAITVFVIADLPNRLPFGQPQRNPKAEE